MDTTMDLKTGQVVKSKAGRDKGKVFLILKVVDDTNVMIVDGDHRKLDSPKLKRIKHLIVYNTIVKDFSDMLESKQKINDADVRKLLEPFSSAVH